MDSHFNHKCVLQINSLSFSRGVFRLEEYDLNGSFTEFVSFNGFHLQKMAFNEAARTKIEGPPFSNYHFRALTNINTTRYYISKPV